MYFLKKVGYLSKYANQSLHLLYSKGVEEWIGNVFRAPLLECWINHSQGTNWTLRGRLSWKGNDKIHLSQGSLLQLWSDGFCVFRQLHGELPKWEYAKCTIPSHSPSPVRRTAVNLTQPCQTSVRSILAPDDPQLWDRQMMAEEESDRTLQKTGCRLS